MRDPIFLIDLLRECSEDTMGRTDVMQTLGMNEEQQKRRHHANLLVGAGHAFWISSDEQIMEITMEGYDFLNAIDSQEKAKDSFLKWFEKGVSYLECASKAVELANSLGLTG